MAQKGSLNIPFVLRPVGYLGEGQNRYVASPERYSTIGYNEIVAYAARAAHVPETDITMAMDALYDAFSYFVCNGHGVVLPNLGIFTFGINAKAAIDETGAGADAVYRTKINFLPVKELRNVLNNVSISVLPLNPNDLLEGFANKAGVLGINLRKGGVSIPLQKYRMYKADATSRYTVRLSGPTAVLPTLVLAYMLADGQTGTVEMSGNRVGSNVIYDATNYMAGLPEYSILQLTVKFEIDGVQHLYVLPFSSTGGAFVPYEVSFMGQSVVTPLMDTPQVTVNYEKLVKPDPKAVRALIISGVNCNNAASLGVSYDTGATPVIKAVGMDQVRILVPADVRVITFVGGVINAQFTIAEGEQGEAIPVITSLSANGITVGNNGSSTIVAGSSYNFTLSGVNLDKLPRDAQSFGAEIIAAGATISFNDVTANAIRFTMSNAKAGSFKVKNAAGNTIFTLTLTEYQAEANAPVITSINNVNNGGSLSLTANSETSLTVRGSNLTELSAANFSMTNGTIVSLSGATATSATLKVRSNGGTGSLRYTINGSVIYTMSITSTSTSGGNGTGPEIHDGVTEW